MQEAKNKLRPMDLLLADGEEDLLAGRSASARPDIRLPLQFCGEGNADCRDRQSISFEDKVGAKDSDPLSTKEDASSAVSYFAFHQETAEEEASWLRNLASQQTLAFKELRASPTR